MGSITKPTAVVAVIGAGGRECTLAWKLAQSDNVEKVLVVPGNAYTGSSAIAKVSNATFDQDVQSPAAFPAFATWCHESRVDLVVVGPEAPLAAGIWDYLASRNIACFGPSKAAAELEWNKEFAKRFFDEYEIPTAKWKAFTDCQEACAFIKSAPFEALVVKAAGLAAGKGVVVADSRDHACEEVAYIQKAFGDAGSTVVVEEKLEGPEVSLLCFTDGETVIPMPAAQDAKRIGEGDTGPNTGGMGAYVPVHTSILTNVVYDEIVEYIRKVVKGMAEKGRPYKGILYAGVMLTKDGPKFLEFNCRFGDPEIEALLAVMESDLYEACQSCVRGNLSSQEIRFSPSKCAVCVVAASRDYPEKSDKGTLVHFGNEHFRDCRYDEGIYCFPAGIGISKSGYITNGGRVLMTVGVSDNLVHAAQLAQRGMSSINFDGKRVRKDIAYQSVEKWLTEKSSLTYKDCSVDIDEGDRLVDEFIVPEAKKTQRTGLLHGVGGFGGMFDLTQLDYKEPVLVSGTDGVGTKLLIAEDTGHHESVGIDLVAMSVNDILTHSAEPLFFLDYFATGKLSADTAGLVMKGIVKGCEQSDCALIGGETAEMPGMYPPGRYDLAGFAVGVVEKSEMLPRPDEIEAEDIVIGLPSSGIHSNGYSLVRRVFAESGHPYNEPAPFNLDKTLANELLTPTKIYVKALLPLLRSDLKQHILGLAHITGGGLTENIPRILPKNLDAILDAHQWPVLPVFSWLAFQGKVASAEMARTFNMGIGMVAIVKRDSADQIIERIKQNGEIALVIGKVAAGKQKVRISGLESALLSSYMSWSVKTPQLDLGKKCRVGIMISGTGTNMEALVAYSRNPKHHSKAEVVVVFSNKADALGVEKARSLGIAVEVIDHRKFSSREEYDLQVNDCLKKHGVEMVCLAGYMRICSGVFVGRWRGRCINTHPAILPAFKGKDAVKLALDEKVRISGCSVHFVEEDVDAGGVIFQAPVPVFPDDTHDTLSERIKAVEHQIFPKAMEAVARGDAVRGENGKVEWNNYRHYKVFASIKEEVRFFEQCLI